MSDDLIEDAIDCLRGEGWDNEADAVDRSVAEIKRLREIERFYNSQKQEIKEFCRIIDEAYDSLICNRTGLNEQHDLPEGIRRMAEQLIAKDAEIESLKSTLNYIDNLKGRYAILIRDHARDKIAKDVLNNDLIANCNQLRDRCWKAEGNLARWQKIAIDEKAKQMDGPCQFRTSYEWCDNLQALCDGFPHMWEYCPNKDRWRSEAAKELNLQVTQEAGYVGRLEEAFVGEVTDALWMAGADHPHEKAIAALTKIREGKP